MVYKGTNKQITELNKVNFKTYSDNSVQERTDQQELIFNQISSAELVKFLNSHERLGMTEEKQNEYIELIDIIADKIARKISVQEVA
jgi:hypothetical protein